MSAIMLPYFCRARPRMTPYKYPWIPSNTCFMPTTGINLIESAVTSGSSVKSAVIGSLKATRQDATDMKTAHAIRAVTLKNRFA